MNKPSIVAAMHSIRTRFGMVTACTLLGLLFAFYLGGRYILVHMIRQAEQSIQVVGDDIKSVVYGELAKLQTATCEAADLLAHAGGGATPEFLQGRLGDFSGDMPINLAVALTGNGGFNKGWFQAPSEPLHSVEASEIQAYLDSAPLLIASVADGQSVSGLISFHGKPLFVSLAPVKGSRGNITDFIILGSLFQNAALITRIHTATHGMQVAVNTHALQHAVPSPKVQQQPQHIAPVFHEALNFYAGGLWHLGENTFEAVIPINDILGKEVTAISISLPGSFSSIASIALGWLTSFIAFVGILFVLPIFWFQGKIVLNPLTAFTRQIKEIGERHLDGDAAAIQWPHNDEFGVLATSVNEMVQALANKTEQNKLSEQRQRALIAGMPDCLCVFDAQARLVSLYKQPDYALPIPGLVPGQPISPLLFPENDCEALRAAIDEASHNERIQMVILSCREADGDYRHFETRISRMDPTQVLVVLRDVTKEWRDRETRAQVEDRLAKVEKMESLGTLAAGIAHDFNNILAIIQNTIENVWEDPTLNEQVAIGTIRQATSKGAALTRELMTYAGHTRIAFKREDPNAIILDLEKLMGGVIASNVILELKLTQALPFVDLDPHQFWKVIINLLKNASEAMNGSSGHIRISTYPLDLTVQNVDTFFTTHALQFGRGVVFQVDDTGSGIPKEVIDRIFEPFFSTKAVGRGLGLATVFGIVDSHNGGIAIESEPGKGTSFRVWLPVSKDQTPAPETKPSAPAPVTPSENPLVEAGAVEKDRLVLLVEDDPFILQTTMAALRSLHVSALAAASKREALSLFRKNAEAIGLILLDAQIGNLDNVRLLSTLRMRKPGVPTVIISGHNEERIRKMFESEPFDGFLGKPYTRDELKDVLSLFAVIT